MLTERVVKSLYTAYEGITVFEVLKRKEDFELYDENVTNRDVPLHYIQVDSEISRVRIIAKELELLVAENIVKTLKELYGKYITSPYHINYSVYARVSRLKLKETMNWQVYKILKEDAGCINNENDYTDILRIIIKNNSDYSVCNCKTAKIFRANTEIRFEENCQNKFFAVLEMLIADSIFCLEEVLRLTKTAGDSFLFAHQDFAETYYYLEKWAIIYEVFTLIKDNRKQEIQDAIRQICDTRDKQARRSNILSKENMQIHRYLEKLIGKNFNGSMSSYYYRTQALSHLYKSIETHSGGRAYYNLLEQMYFIRGDYDDITSHFNVAADRFVINNNNIDKIKDLKKRSKSTNLYDIEKYFEKE